MGLEKLFKVVIIFNFIYDFNMSVSNLQFFYPESTTNLMEFTPIGRPAYNRGVFYGAYYFPGSSISSDFTKKGVKIDPFPDAKVLIII